MERHSYVNQLVGSIHNTIMCKQLCCGCLERCHLVNIWLPSFLNSPSLFLGRDFILGISVFGSHRQKAQALICSNNHNITRHWWRTGLYFIWTLNLGCEILCNKTPNIRNNIMSYVFLNFH